MFGLPSYAIVCNTREHGQKEKQKAKAYYKNKFLRISEFLARLRSLSLNQCESDKQRPQ